MSIKFHSLLWVTLLSCFSAFSFKAIAYVETIQPAPVAPVVIIGDISLVPIPKNVYVPTTNASGNYTIQWNGGDADLNQVMSVEKTNDAIATSTALDPKICPGECVREYIYTLEESNNGVDFQVIYTGSNKTFYVWGRESGAYVYRLKAAELQKEDYVYSDYTELFYTAVVRTYSAPATITVPTTTVTTEAITISWASHEKATYYTLEERVNDGVWATLTSAGSSHITATSYTRANPSNGRYQYRVNTCTDSACGNSWNTSTEVLVYWPRNATSTSAEKWIPILVGDITIFIPNPSVVQSELTIPSNLLTEQLNIGTVLYWDGHASQYQIQGLNSSGQWVTILVTGFTSVLVDGQFDGYSALRVAACSNSACTSTGSVSAQISLANESSAPKNVATTIAPVLSNAPVSGPVGETIRTLGGAFRVDESGGATYSIPVSMPQGIAGVSPSLTFDYSSSAGNGIMGMGWGINGASSIMRCRQTKQHEGRITPLQMNSDDRFCLDGQKLFAVEGDYGSDVTKYRTEIDNKSRITSYGTLGSGPEYFTVERVDGSISYYGDGGNSLHVNNATDTVIGWYISSFKDNLRKTENTINYCYTNGDSTCETGAQSAGQNEIHLETIEYSGNKVIIEYEARSDTRTGYIHGEIQESVLRVKELSVENHNRDLLRTYNPSYLYNQQNGVSVLDTLTECNSDGVCLPAIDFDWTTQSLLSTGGSGATCSVSNGCLSDDDILGFKPIDFNGDGFMDLSYVTTRDMHTSGNDSFYLIILENKNGSYEEAYNFPFNIENAEDLQWHIADLNGDGNQDVLIRAEFYTGEKWAQYLFDDSTRGYTYSTFPFETVAGKAPDLLVFDFDTDGLPDLISGVKNENTDYYSVYINQGGTYANKRVLYNTSSTDDYRITDLNESLSGDFNGDGVADLMVKMARTPAGSVRLITSLCDPGRPCSHAIPMSYWQVFVTLYDTDNNPYLSPYQRLAYGAGQNSTAEQQMKNFRTGDINGDGLTDLMYTRHYDNNLMFLYSTGTGFRGVLYEDGSASEVGAPNSSTYKALHLIDVNGDAKADVLYYTPNDYSWHYHVSTSDGFAEAKTKSGPRRMSDGSENRFDSALFADFNGDGTLELFTADFQNDKFVFGSGTTSIKPNLKIERITNGFGVSTDIEYGLMTNSSLYQKGDTPPASEASSEAFTLLPPNFVVSKVTSDAPSYNSLGTTYDANKEISVSYKYEGLRVQAGGRGFLGFRKLITTDDQTGIRTTTKYSQIFPFIGMPLETISQTANGSILNLSRNTLNSKSLQGGVTVYPYIESTVDRSAIINTSGSTSGFIAKTITVNTYLDTEGDDNHYNLTKVEVETYDAVDTLVKKVTTNNQYLDEDINKWWLGRVTDSDVTHLRPAAVAQPTITRTSDFSYHATTGMLIEEVIASGQTNQLTTLHCYDTFGNETETITYANITDVTCSSNNVITENDNNKIFRRNVKTYDTESRYVTSEGNDKFTLLKLNVISRNKFGQPTETLDINGITTKIAFDSFGAQYFTSNSLGQSSTVERSYSVTPSITEAYKFAETITGAGKPASIKYFDALGRQVASATQSFDNSWVLQYSRYDYLGQTVKQTTPFYKDATQYWNSNIYDTYGRLTSSVNANNVTSSITRTGLTEVVSTNANDSLSGIQTKTSLKNVLGETISVTDNAGTVAFNFNAVGDLVKVIGVDTKEINSTFNSYSQKIGMTDPNKGTWVYSYNALNELKSQTNSRGYITNIYRDSVGRTIEKSTTGNNINTSLNFNYTDLSQPNDISHLLQSTSGHSEDKTYFYDGFGRVSQLRTTIEGDTYTQQTTYDNYGRVFQTFDADNTSLIGCVSNGSAVGSCWGIQNVYKTNGYLEKQIEARNGADANANVYYQIKAMDALGNVSEFSQNNDNITSTKVYNQASGFIESITANNSSVNVQSNVYDFDGLGNLRSRTNDTLKTGTLGQSEIFGYDNMNRLTHTNGTEKVKYYANGNIKWKEGVGSYCYNESRPNAVSGIGNEGCTTQTYQYDSNGNMTSGRNRRIDYGYFDKATRIENTLNNSVTHFTYGANNSRFKRTSTEKVDGIDVTSTTYYVGNLEVVSKSNSNVITTRRNLPGAVELRRSNGTQEISFLLKDHLGSLDTIINGDNKIVHKLYFDTWGKKHQIDKSNISLIASQYVAFSLTQLLDITPRGYTGHESVDHADIIHMNGRIYDPTLGRFLQADPHIQAPDNSQSYNRYSYVLNNPLSYTDPSGYFFKKLIGAVVAIVGTYICGPECGKAGYALIGAISGATSAAVNGGNIIKGAFTGAFSALAFYGVGQAFDPGTLGNVIGNAVTGGIMSDLQGGNFGHGFFAAGFAAAAKPAIYDKFGYSPEKAGARVVTAAVIGGTASVISGGKFTNGAVTAAFSQMFNGESYAKKKWGQIQSFAKNVYDNYLNSTQSAGVSFEMPWRIDGEWSSFGVEFGVVSQSIFHPDGFDIGAYVMTTAGKSLLPWGDVKGTMDLTLSQGSISDFSGSGGIADVQTPWGGSSVARSNSGLWAGSISPGFGLGAGGSIYTTRAVSLFGGYHEAECSSFVCQ